MTILDSKLSKLMKYFNEIKRVFLGQKWHVSEGQK